MWLVKSLSGPGISGLESRSPASFLGLRLDRATLIILDLPLVRVLPNALLGGDEYNDGVESKLPGTDPSSAAGEGVLTWSSCICEVLANCETN